MEQYEAPYDAIYARQSIDKADSISIESQIEFCKYETRGHSFQVYSDKGYSGKNTARPDFQRMMDHLRKGKIRRVICYKLDRCSRSILDFTALMEEFQKYGVEFVSCTEKFDTSTPMGRAMLNICVVFAQLERETIQQRVTDAYRSRSLKGFYMGGRIPFGFQLGTCEIDGKHTSCYVPADREVAILKLLFRRYADPGASLGSVVASLNTDGIRNPRRPDGKWIRSNIGKILSNPIYVKADLAIYQYFREREVTICNDPMEFSGTNGCYLYHAEGQPHLVIAPHEGLIPSQLWLRCRKNARNSTRAAGHTKRPSHYLSGKLKCASCGKGLTISRRKSKQGASYQYIICPYAFGPDRSCKGLRGWKLSTMEQIVQTVILAYLQRLQADGTVPNFMPDAEQNELLRKIVQLQYDIEKNAEKAIDAPESLLPYFGDKIDRLIQNKKELILRKEKLDNQQPMALGLDYAHIWEQLPVEEKNQVVSALLECICVSEAEIHFYWR